MSTTEQQMHNVIIIGGGMAALTAALYAARAELHPLVISGRAPDQLSLTTDVENYPGFPDGVQGPELVQRCRQQAEKFGGQFVDVDATGFRQENDKYVVETEDGGYAASSVIIASGARAKTLGLESEEKFFGKGVSTCATCDAALFKGKDIVVVGGGDSAMEESLFLSKFANSVTIVHRRDEFRASQIMQNRVFNKDTINVVWNHEVEEVLGEQIVAGVRITHVETGETQELDAQGMFLAIGHIPNTEYLEESAVELDEHGYLKANRRMHTNLPGVFAAGDVQDTIYRQAVTAAGTGCQAAMEAEQYLQSLED